MSRPYISVSIKENVIQRAEGRCEYCKSMQKYSPQPFHIEHIIPVALGGLTILINLAFACGGCNNINSDCRSVCRMMVVVFKTTTPYFCRL